MEEVDVLTSDDDDDDDDDDDGRSGGSSFSFAQFSIFCALFPSTSELLLSNHTPRTVSKLSRRSYARG